MSVWSKVFLLIIIGSFFVSLVIVSFFYAISFVLGGILNKLLGRKPKPVMVTNKVDKGKLENADAEPVNQPMNEELSGSRTANLVFDHETCDKWAAKVTDENAIKNIEAGIAVFCETCNYYLPYESKYGDKETMSFGYCHLTGTNT